MELSLSMLHKEHRIDDQPPYTRVVENAAAHGIVMQETPTDRLDNVLTRFALTLSPSLPSLCINRSDILLPTSDFHFDFKRVDIPSRECKGVVRLDGVFREAGLVRERSCEVLIE